MRTWKDSASGNIIVAVDEKQKLVLLRTKNNENFRELAVFSWEEGRYCLEDIRDDVERVLHKKDGGIWHLGDEPLEHVDIDMSTLKSRTQYLPFQKAAFAMWDSEKGEVIALLVAQSKMGIFSVQAYVGEGNTLDGIVLTKRGTPEVVTEVEVEVPGKHEYKFFINLGPDDVCKVVYRAGMSPYEVYCYRGGGRMRTDGDGSKLVVLDPRPAFFAWRFEGEGNTAITFTKRR